MLKIENQRLKLRAQIQGKQAVRGKNKPKGKQKLKPAEREIVDVVKTILWRECKNITTHKKWKKAGGLVIDNYETTEFDNLSEVDLEIAKEAWIEKNQDLVMGGLNTHRNYVIGELRNHMMDVFRDGKQGEVPNKDEMLLCALP